MDRLHNLFCSEGKVQIYQHLASLNRAREVACRDGKEMCVPSPLGKATECRTPVAYLNLNLKI